MAYELAKYHPDFRDEIVKLQTHLWSSDLAVNSEYFRWKYEQNPYLPNPHVYLALHERRVVGMRGMYGAEWEIGTGHRLIAPCGGDTCVLPEHRNRGLFRKINEFALDDLARRGFTYVFNLSAARVTYLRSLRLDWRSAGPFTMLRRSVEQTSPSQTIRSLRLHPDLSLDDAPRAAAMANLIRRHGLDGRVRHVRDQEFFEWRLRNPLSRYRYIYWGTNELRGYLVLQERLYREQSHLSIADWEAPDDEIKLLLLEAAIASAKRDILIWSASLSANLLRQLEACGFTTIDEWPDNNRHRPSLLVRRIQDRRLDRPRSVAHQRLLDIKNWDLRMIYSDSF